MIKDKQEISVYQLQTKTWNFYEYNMAGIILKRSDFSSIFKDLKVLAVADATLKYLLTPIGKDHLQELKILEISNEH